MLFKNLNLNHAPYMEKKKTRGNYTSLIRSSPKNTEKMADDEDMRIQCEKPSWRRFDYLPKLGYGPKPLFLTEPAQSRNLGSGTGKGTQLLNLGPLERKVLHLYIVDLDGKWLSLSVEVNGRRVCDLFNQINAITNLWEI